MPYLIYNPETAGQVVYELHLGANTLGRGRQNNIVVIHQSLSRQHAQIEVADGIVTIADLSSSNGTFVNEAKIKRCKLNDGDRILCGKAVFKFLERLESSRHRRSNKAIKSEREAPVSFIKKFPQSSEIDDVPMQQLLARDRDNGTILQLRQEDTQQRAVDKLKILLQVSKQLSAPEEPERLLEKIINLLFEIMRVDRGAILLVNEQTGFLEQKAVRVRKGIKAEGERFYSQKITNSVLERGEAILTVDARNDDRLKSESVILQCIHASACVPLKPRDKTIGVLYVDNLSMLGAYSEEDVDFLSCLANQAAIAIENAQLYNKMQQEALMLDKLQRFFPTAVSRKIREEGPLGIIETEVTALFSDISGFTAMSETMEPRQVISMLNDYFQIMVEDIVFRYEGTLEKYIGDALFAIWGAPYQKANDAEQAVLAAIEMQQAVARLNQQEWAERYQPIKIHIGINTGKVAAGNIGSEKLIQYATIGDTTNVTSRICSAAEPDEILISQSTFDKLGHLNLPIRKIPPVAVKGKKEPLQLYRVFWQKKYKTRAILKK
ncbi:MAG: FHA domain-containing protein [Oscillatoria sp. SIO1A7]|nr:FHA domain-containing protein [Oscillatoria sp. SIO1A7]